LTTPTRIRRFANRIYLLCIAILLLNAYASGQNKLPGKLSIRELDSIFRLQPNRATITGIRQLPSPVTRPNPTVNPFNVTRPQSITKTFNKKVVKSTTAGKIIRSNSTLNPQLTVCYDTSGRYFLQNDTMTYYVTHTTLLSDGSIAACGEALSQSFKLYGGFLMKFTDSGTLKWVRIYDSVGRTQPAFLNYHRVIELKDGTFLLAGLTNDPGVYDNDILLTHVDQTGSIIWSKNYKSRVWQLGYGDADHFFIADVKQDPASGDIFFTGNHWIQGKNVTRLRISDGSIVWSNYYQTRGWAFDYPFGLDIRSNDIMLFSKFNHDYYGSVISSFKINKATGDTISSKYFTAVDPSRYNLGVLHTDNLVKLNNGNYGLTGKLFKFYRWGTDTTDLYHGTVMEFDNDGNFKNAYAFRNNHESNLQNTRISLNKDGSGVFSMLRYFSGWTADVYYVQFKNGQITRQRVKHYVNEGMPLENSAIRVADGGDVFIKLLGDSVTNINKIEFLKLHTSDTSSACLGVDDRSTYIEPYTFEPVQLGFDSIGVNDFYVSKSKTITASSQTLKFDPACRQISNCDTIALRASADTVCVGSPILITVLKNPECGATPFINYDATVVDKFSQVNDSVYSFIFKSATKMKISASIEGCTLLEDSVTVVVRASKGAVNLGPDKEMCSGNMFILKAGKDYANYLWQDGSTDSQYVASTTGLYHVTVTDYCGNTFRDTVSITPHPPISFNAGADTVICRGDTLHFTAPASFINYKWSPDYRISSTTTQSVRISPVKDTTYFISAERAGGCMVYDTIHIQVRDVARVNLGSDISFCDGDSAVVDAGAGFNSYRWNNGTAAQKITVRSEGKFSVVATDANGCRAKDTVAVLNVYNKPQPDLGSRNWICKDAAVTLDAGSFTQYLWNTGSVDRSITVNETGLYSVLVVDNNSCTGQASIDISRTVESPHNFLPADTSICNYGTHIFKPAEEFSDYLWSTGSSNNSIAITTAGEYWLEVRDAYDCVGRDSIRVSVKECLQGFFIPNAFTPDGKNNTFKPMIFGDIEKYEFTIFNRWGQLIFKSNDPSKGWDGQYGGSTQNTETFVWFCRYKLVNEPVKEQKGVVVLIR
jgi:gliding motility-associated-like protein